MQDIDIRSTAQASPAAIWRLLGTSATWPDWTPIERHAREQAGGADGVGEIRAFTTGRVTVREEIVERVPDRRLGYALLSGLALRDYRADIDLTPTAEGTEIRWHTTFRPKVPGAGWIYHRALQKITQQFVDGLVRASSAATAPAPAPRPPAGSPAAGRA